MMMLKPQPKALPTNRPAQPAAAPLLQLQAFGTLLGQSMARSMQNGAATAAVLPATLSADTAAELLALQVAVFDRIRSMQQDWWQAWGGWLQECGQLRRANTMSEHLEQQYNVMEQATALLKSQAADLMTLQENVEVDYGYWVSQKLQGE